MKPNEILLIGGALIAALVLSKGRGLSSPQTNTPFNNPFSNLLGEAQTKAVEKLESNVDRIKIYEKTIYDVNIKALNLQLDKAQSYLSQQQKIPPGSTFGVPVSKGFNAQLLVSKFMESFNRFGGFTGQSIYPDVNIPFTKSNLQLAEQAAQYETAQKNITSTNKFIDTARDEISKLQKEYQTKYGNLSRYG